MVHRLGQELSELLVVEDLEATSAGDLADSSGVEAVVVVTVAALDKDAGVAQALCVHLPAHVVQVHSWLMETTCQSQTPHRPPSPAAVNRGPTFADVSAGVLDCRVAVDVGQQSEAEAVLVVRGVCEAVHQHAGRRGVISLAHAIVELVVDNGAPVARLLVLYRLHICQIAQDG